MVKELFKKALTNTLMPLTSSKNKYMCKLYVFNICYKSVSVVNVVKRHNFDKYLIDPSAISLREGMFYTHGSLRRESNIKEVKSFLWTFYKSPSVVKKCGRLVLVNPSPFSWSPVPALISLVIVPEMPSSIDTLSLVHIFTDSG